MIKDALSEGGTLRHADAGEPQPVAKVRCEKGKTLIDEPAKFCSACGSPL